MVSTGVSVQWRFKIFFKGMHRYMAVKAVNDKWMCCCSVMIGPFTDWSSTW